MTLSCILWTTALLTLGQQGTPSGKVAVVYIPEVSDKYQKTKDLEDQFENVRRKLNDERETLRAKVERTSRSLKEEFKPGTEEHRARRRELAMLETQLQNFVESEGKRIEQDLADSLRGIFDDIQAAVKAVAEEKGLDVVLAADKMPEAGTENPSQVRQQIILQKVLYWHPRIDITADVVKRLNANYKPAATNK